MNRKHLAAVLTVLVALGMAYRLRLFNRPPRADFEIKPKYINPTEETLIKFINRSTDPDGDPLDFAWYVDGRLTNESIDHVTRLTVGEHTVKLTATDGNAQNSVETKITIERKSFYDLKKLTVSVKGVCYNIGIAPWREFRSPEDEEILEDLEVIRNELGCNAIRIFGDNKGKMMFCAKQAIALGFNIVLLNPFHIDIDLDEAERRTVDLAKEAQSLFQESDAVVLSAGNELTIDVNGLAPSPTRDQRKTDDLRSPTVQQRLNDYLKKIVPKVKQVFRGPITYAAGNWENVEWNRIGFDLVSMNLYLNAKNYDYLRRLIKQLLEVGKPVWATEFGQCTYEGAFQYPGAAQNNLTTQPYNQTEQAEAIKATLDFFDGKEIKACFLWKYKAYKDDDRRNYGILRYQGKDRPMTRKLGFYLYKSYVLANSSSIAEAIRNNQLFTYSGFIVSVGKFTEMTIVIGQAQRLRTRLEDW